MIQKALYQKIEKMSENPYIKRILTQSAFDRMINFYIYIFETTDKYR